TAQRHAAGLFGRKTGRGFYQYRDGKAVKPPEAPVPRVDAAAVPVWISCRHPDAAAMVDAVVTGARARRDTRAQPAGDALIVVTPFGEDATTAALSEHLDPAHTVAIDCLFGLGRRRTLMATPVTRAPMRAAAHALLAADGAAVTMIRDSAGFIAQRIAACIVNIGCHIAQPP